MKQTIEDILIAEKYKLINEASKRQLKNKFDTNVDNLKKRMIAGEDVIGQLNKTPSVIAIFHLDHGGEFAYEEDFTKNPQLLPPTAVPISTSAWYDSNQKEPDYDHVFVKIYITNTSKEAIDFVNVYTKEYDEEESNRTFGFMKDIYKALGIDGYEDPKLPRRDWLAHNRLPAIKDAISKNNQSGWDL